MLFLLLCAGFALAAPEDKRVRQKAPPNKPTQNSNCNDVPDHPVDVILGRPGHDTITLSVLAYRDAEGCVAYGTDRGRLTAKTPLRQFKNREPAEVVLSGLTPNTRYYYEFQGRGIPNAAGTFHTQRSLGGPFTFTITADSHLDDRVDAKLYERALANALADSPDLHVDLGDTFMTEKHDSRENASRQYLAQRYYFGQLCHSTPLFLALGNHDGESPRGRGDDADSLAVWSNAMRKKYFPNPVPNAFYTGNSAKHPEAGLLEDYFAWEWGDALFVVLDPFWFTQKQRGRSDNWKRTLGEAQYQWLAGTLERSTARFKFVFIHHLVGGATSEARGGIEAAPFFEWGGKNLDGSDGFRENRPGWPMPIHPLLVKHRVSAVFHGHDHLYVKQDLDGIVYQEVPQPGTPGHKKPRTAEEYGYLSGVILPSAGHLRVKVAATESVVEYVRAEADGPTDGGNGAVAHSYRLLPR